MKHGVVPFNILGILLAFYSNFVPKMQRFEITCNYTVTLKPGLEVTQGHRNRHVSIRHL